MGRATCRRRRPRGAGLDRQCDVALDPVPLALGDERSDHGRRIVRIADRDRADAAATAALDRLVVAVTGGTSTRVWAPQTWPERCMAPPTTPGRPGEVGVVEDDGRRLPAELERDPLDLLPAQAHDPLAGRRRAGERDLVGARVGHQVLADLAAGGHDVDHARRDARVGEGLGQDEVAQRGLGRRA